MTRSHVGGRQANAAPLVAFAALIAPLLLATPATAQVPCFYPTVSARSPGTCNDAPLRCQGASSQQSTGIWEFDIYPAEACPAYLSGMRFGLTWPSAWNLLSWETCEGAIAVGDLKVPGDGLEITFSPCTDAQRAAVRVVMNCTVPGRFSFALHPSGRFDYRGCGSPEWHPYEGPIFTYVEIGDYCGASPLDAPCGYFCSSHPAGNMNPNRIDAAIYEGGELTVAFSVSLYQGCPAPPECCGSPCAGECAMPIAVTDPWIQLEEAGTGAYGSELYVVHLDSAGLPPGMYSGRIASGEPACGFCHSICAQVNLEVLPCGPALERSALPSGVLRRVPDDYPTITAALAASAPGDTVGVREGTYKETFSPRDGIAVLGGYDPTFSIRDPEVHETVLTSSGRIMTCLGCVGAAAVIDGFTWTGGAGDEGGLIKVENAFPTITNNRFEGAQGGRGGAVYLVGSATNLSDNVFVNNLSTEVGGALTIAGSQGTMVSDCRFESNSSAVSGGAIFLDQSFDAVISRCFFVDNEALVNGGAVVLQNSEALLDSCVFAGNNADQGGAVGVVSFYSSSLTNCTIVDNVATRGGGIFVAGRVSVQRSILASNTGRGIYRGGGPPVENLCNDVWNNMPTDYYGVSAGPNTFSLDPLFCNAPARDFILESDSPCAPDHTPSGCGLIGALRASVLLLTLLD